MAEIPILGEHVPIPIDDYASLKDLLEKGRRIGVDASIAGLRASKALAYANEKAVEADALEQAIDEKVREVVLKSKVPMDKFEGIDMERGVINLKKEVANVG